MLPSHHWVYNFTVTPEELDALVNDLVEGEVPRTTHQLAYQLVERRLQREKAALEERYKDALPYNPAASYQIGQKLVFPALDYATATITGSRPGQNNDYGEFTVLIVDLLDSSGRQREFAAAFQPSHPLSSPLGDSPTNTLTIPEIESLTPEAILDQFGGTITLVLEEELRQLGNLIYLGREWFPKDLVIEINEGHLNLAEAVLDINNSQPLTATEIIEQIGGLGYNSPLPLQTFSINHTLNHDPRFDEVGPTGQVLWYLTRMEPAELTNPPTILKYTPVDYSAADFPEDWLDLEMELGDEFSNLSTGGSTNSATVNLIYPHRRHGTFPLSAYTRAIFPTAERTSRIWIHLVDSQDGETFVGWVVPQWRFVYGFAPLYNKHAIPIGGDVTVKRTDHPTQIMVEFNVYKARTEWVRTITPADDDLVIEEKRRAVGAHYDDFMIFGVDDLAAMDTFVQAQQRKTLPAILRIILGALGKTAPQGAVHFKTIYSLVNAIRRFPPGPILAILRANPDFENVDGPYWRLAGRA